MKFEDEELVKYFQKLGYQVSWDWNFGSPNRDIWYEILEDNKLICQIDRGIPLSDIIEDFKCWYLGIEATSKSNYKVNIRNNKETRFNELLAKVYNHENRKR